MQGFTLDIEKLGPIQKTSITPRPLTIFCGDNHTGKTHVMYALWGISKLYHQDAYIASIQTQKTFSSKEEMITDAKHSAEKLWHSYPTFVHKKFIERITPLYNSNLAAVIKITAHNNLESLHETFRSKLEEFEFLFGDFDEKQNPLGDFFVYTSCYFNLFSSHSVIFIPAERVGLNLMYQEITRLRARNAFTGSFLDLQKFNQTSVYQLPIEEYRDFLASVSELKQSILVQRRREYGKSYQQIQTILHELETEVLDASFQIADDGSLTLDHKTGQHQFHLGSSTQKSLYGLWAYLKYQAIGEQTIFIDEPELNLHPDKQRKLARIFAKMVNAGIHVVMSTHSDYILREFSNLIMLKDPFAGREEIIQKHGYAQHSDAFLSVDQVAPYVFEPFIVTEEGQNTPHIAMKATEMPKSPAFGIEIETFNRIIRDLNDASDAIFFAKESMQDDTTL